MPAKQRILQHSRLMPSAEQRLTKEVDRSAGLPAVAGAMPPQRWLRPPAMGRAAI
jgi:hypothetical protein